MKTNRIALVALNEPQNRKVVANLRDTLQRRDIKITNSKPDAVVVIGREGSLLFAEQKFPGVSKLFLKHERNCKKCRVGRTHRLNFVGWLKRGKFKLVKLQKLEARVNGKKKFDALNDVNVHYRPPTALRFSVAVNSRQIAQELIGDGVVVATPYGSGAYFSSITGKRFSRGIGVAFNNTTKKQRSRILGKNAKVRVKIYRGPGTVCCDCNRNVVALRNGDVVDIAAGKEVAKLIRFGKDVRIVLK